MDIQRLRSWIFELYTPLDDERQYIVFDAARGNLLIDIPPYSERALRLIQGAGRASLLLATNADRAVEAHRYRETLGVQIAVHEDDAAAVVGGADLVLGADDLVRPDARVVRVKANGQGATVVLVRKSGGVPFTGDLDLASDGAKELIPLTFSSVLSSKRAPIWNAGRDTLLQLQRELPKPRKQFGILLPPPWDRASSGSDRNRSPRTGGRRRRNGRRRPSRTPQPTSSRPPLDSSRDRSARASVGCRSLTSSGRRTSITCGAASISRRMAPRSRSRGIRAGCSRSTARRSSASAFTSSPTRRNARCHRAGRRTRSRSRSYATRAGTSASISGSSTATARPSATSPTSPTSCIATSRGRRTARASRTSRTPTARPSRST